MKSRSNTFLAAVAVCLALSFPSLGSAMECGMMGGMMGDSMGGSMGGGTGDGHDHSGGEAASASHDHSGGEEAAPSPEAAAPAHASHESGKVNAVDPKDLSHSSHASHSSHDSVPSHAPTAASQPAAASDKGLDWNCGWCEDGIHHHPSVWTASLLQSGRLAPGSLKISCPEGLYPPSQEDGKPTRATAEIAKHEVGKYLAAIGNPNLKVGKAIDKPDYWEVQVVTHDGSLVDTLYWDKDFVGFYCDCPYHQALRKKLRGEAPAANPAVTGQQAAEAVRARAAVDRNPNLRIGETKFDGQTYRVEVVTRDGSLVERYFVDPTTGAAHSEFETAEAAPPAAPQTDSAAPNQEKAAPSHEEHAGH